MQPKAVILLSFGLDNLIVLWDIMDDKKKEEKQTHKHTNELKPQHTIEQMQFPNTKACNKAKMAEMKCRKTENVPKRSKCISKFKTQNIHANVHATNGSEYTRI